MTSRARIRGRYTKLSRGWTCSCESRAPTITGPREDDPISVPSWASVMRRAILTGLRRQVLITQLMRWVRRHPRPNQLIPRSRQSKSQSLHPLHLRSDVAFLPQPTRRTCKDLHSLHARSRHCCERARRLCRLALLPPLCRLLLRLGVSPRIRSQLTRRMSGTDIQTNTVTLYKDALTNPMLMMCVSRSTRSSTDV